MILSMNWLKEFVPGLNVTTKAFCDRMTATGSKVEGFEVLGSEIENVKVGLIEKIEKHPDADRLVVCRVNIGEEAPIQIITAATNVFEGALVPAAVAPAKVVGGEIKKTKMRGVDSFGMFCSIAELNLTLHDMPDAVENGILILNGTDCKPGDDIRDVLALSDTAVEFEITPNRPDCLSVIGLAREAGVSFDLPVNYHKPVVKGSGDDIKNYLSVEIKDAKRCPRYTARYIKNVKIAPSPLWMRRALRASGVRPINNIVDITNYVMLEYGQPMHAFDSVCLDGSKIVVRTAEKDEKFVSLDSVDHTLNETMLVISDAKKAVALAGVMGGENSEIKETTKSVVFESANFLGASVRVTAKSLGMRTESSARFEKGLDPENALPALERACELVELLGAGEVVDGVIDVYPGKKPETVLPLEADRINAFLGLNVDADFMKKALTNLDFRIEGDMVHVPSFRADVECMNDLAEEVLRIYGYDTIQATPFRSSIRIGGLNPEQDCRRKLCDLLCSLGADEIMTFSFISPKYYDKICLPESSPLRRSVTILNPLGEDTSVMRTTALPSMLECLARNDNYHSESVCLYEPAKIYLPAPTTDKLPDERIQLTLGMYGDNCDFYALKGIVDAVLSFAGVGNVRYTAKTDDATFHPGRCAEVYTGDTLIGSFGEISRAVQENYGCDKRLYGGTLDVRTIFEHSNFKKEYTPLPKYPASSRDFAFVCDEDLEIGKIEEIMTLAGGKLVEKIKLFDVYRGEQLGENKKSVAFSVTMRAADHTLTDEEADKTSKKILTLLEKELGITLRK